MPRRAAPVPNRHIHTTIPADLATRLELHLWSPSEGRVPQGALQNFLIERINEWFSQVNLDLAAYMGTPPGNHVVSSRGDTIELLKTYLSKPRVL